MEDLRFDLGSVGDFPGSDDLPPDPPPPPREPPDRPGRRTPFPVTPWFLAIAAIVSLERVAMLAVGSPGLGVHVQLTGLAVFCAILLGITLFGGLAFSRTFGR